MLELPLQVNAGQAKRIIGHLEAGRQLYNAVLSEGQRRLQGNDGYLIWKDDRLAANIDWNDPLVTYGLAHRIKYARLIRRKASSPQAQGADAEGCRYFVQLALEGVPYSKPKHLVGSEIIGAELAPDEKDLRRLQRTMDRQRRVANPDNYDAQGRIKKQGQQKLRWKTSRGYEKTRRRKATKERKLAAHRKSLHGKKVHEIVAVGRTILLEKLSYKAWQRRYGKSMGLLAPGMFIELLRRTVASTGGTLHEIPTRTTKLSQ